MPVYYLKISDGKAVETSIDVANAHEATNTALNALTQFACKHFPPPDSLEIIVMDADRERLATLRFDFSIDYSKNFLSV